MIPIICKDVLNSQLLHMQISQDKTHYPIFHEKRIEIDNQSQSITSFSVRTVYNDSKLILFRCISSLRNPVSFNAPTPTTSTPILRITLPCKTEKKKKQ